MSAPCAPPAPPDAPDAPPARMAPARGWLRWTLATRIAALALLPIALATGAGGVWLHAQMQRALHEGLRPTLQDKLDRLGARLSATATGDLADVAGKDEFSAIYSGWYWQAEWVAPTGAQGNSGRAGAAPDAAGTADAAAATGAAGAASAAVHATARSRSLWDAPALTVRTRRHGLLQATGPLGEPLLGLAGDVRVPGLAAPVRVSVFGPAQAVHDNARRIGRMLAASATLLMAALLAILLAQVRLGLAPLRRLVRAIAALRQPAANSAAPAGVAADVPSLHALALGPDLQPLQAELVGLLEHNARTVARARAHAADLNHALKKPLALLAASASRQPHVAARDVLEHVAEMTRLIDRYQARTHGDALPAAAHAGALAQAVPVAECLDALLQAMRRLHAAQDLHWSLDLPDAAGGWRLRGERTDIEEALGNLLDNAGKWAASQVRVGVRRHGALLHIGIEDDGPGMSAAQMHAAGRRGLRFDESVQGTGLGLCIAGQIAEGWGGALSLQKSDALKGLHASLQWPLA